MHTQNCLGYPVDQFDHAILVSGNIGLSLQMFKCEK